MPPSGKAHTRHCAAIQALVAVFNASRRANDLCMADCAFDTPRSRKIALDYIMTRAVRFSNVAVPDALVWSNRHCLMTTTVFRPLANAHNRKASWSEVCNTHKELHGQICGTIVRWIDETNVGTMPDRIEMGWFAGTMAYMAVRNPFVRGERDRLFRFNVGGAGAARTGRPVDDWTQQRRFCASVQALTVIVRAALRDNDLITTDWAFHTPDARSAAFNYLMDRVMQYRGQDVRDAVYSHRGNSKTNATFLRCVQVHRVLANLTMRTGTTASVSMAALGHRMSPLWDDVRGWIAQWIDESIGGEAPKTIDVSWVGARGANVMVRNPIVKGDAAGSFRIDGRV
ncbi:hypothetical protein GGF32_001794 [Allomyces javanicus]|nr:hypothetical protein GGF32_001794 [Allomyces javanicus]